MSEGNLPDKYQERIDELMEDLESTEFYVLVWGSGEENDSDYEKRVEICRHLEERLDPEYVWMSEDEEFDEMTDKFGDMASEAMQAAAAHAVIVLDTSMGPHTEIAIYDEIIQGKTLVFIEEEHAQTEAFAGRAMDALKTVPFTEEEYDDCRMIRRTANDFVQALRFQERKLDGLRKWRRNS